MYDRFVEQPPRGFHRQQAADFLAASGFAEQSNIVRIAAKRFDVLSNPSQSRDEIVLPDVARIGISVGIQRGEIQISKHVEAMIHGDDDDVAFAYQSGAVVCIRCT